MKIAKVWALLTLSLLFAACDEPNAYDIGARAKCEARGVDWRYLQFDRNYAPFYCVRVDSIIPSDSLKSQVVEDTSRNPLIEALTARRPGGR